MLELFDIEQDRIVVGQLHDPARRPAIAGRPEKFGDNGIGLHLAGAEEVVLGQKARRADQPLAHNALGPPAARHPAFLDHTPAQLLQAGRGNKPHTPVVKADQNSSGSITELADGRQSRWPAFWNDGGLVGEVLHQPDRVILGHVMPPELSSPNPCKPCR